MVIENSRISIKDLQFDCIIGTLPYERENLQSVVLNIDLYLDFSVAARNDDLIHSIDYATLAQEIQKFVCNSKFQLVETLVLETGKFILENYIKAFSVEVSVIKPNAIPNAKGAMASIKISR